MPSIVAGLRISAGRGGQARTGAGLIVASSVTVADKNTWLAETKRLTGNG